MPLVNYNSFSNHHGIELVKRFLLIAIPSLLLLVTIATAQFMTHRKMEGIEHSANEIRNIELAHQVLRQELNAVISDLLFLSTLNELQQLLSNPAKDIRPLLEREIASFSRSKGYYDQIRFLDTNGYEKIRINYNNGNIRIIPLKKLQNKSERYYFPHTKNLFKGDIYISEFDLNIENHAIEKPHKPVIRFATPIFTKDGTRSGILILNYLGSNLIADFKRVATNIEDHIMLLNNNGFWLSSPNREYEWGFMLEHKRSFAKLRPEVWKSITQKNQGQFNTTEGLFTFNTIYPLQIATEKSIALPINVASLDESSQHKKRFWKVISHVTPKILAKTSTSFLQRDLFLYSGIALLIIFIAALLAKAWLKHSFVVTQHEYELRFRRTLETMQLAAISIDINGRITFYNDYLLQHTGWQQSDINNHTLLDTLIPDDEQSIAKQMLHQLQTDDSYLPYHECHIKTKQGTPRLFAWNNTLFFDSNGKVTGLMSIGDDITESRNNEESLRKLSRAVEQSASTVIITNLDGIIEYVNPKFVQLTGYTSEEVIGQTPKILQSGETSDDEYANLWDTLSHGKEWRGEFHNRKKNGDLYWESASISPIRNSEGELTHFLAVKEDITERKRLEAEVEQNNRKLAHHQALTAMGRMASMVAHDLRNPLSSIKMGIRILGKKATQKPDKEAEELQQIGMEQVRYMETILSDLLQFSRPDELQPEWLSINKILDLSIGVNQRIINEYDIKVTTEYQDQLPTLHGDATKLRQVFSNLITNALQACEGIQRKPKVTIRTNLEIINKKPNIKVEICDNGVGISHDNKDKIFEPFFTTRSKGTGLGLPIVKRIIDQHHGNLLINSYNIDRTCVIVILPTDPIQV